MGTSQLLNTNCFDGSHHELLFLLVSLEASVAEFGRGIDELQLDFLAITPTQADHQRLQNEKLIGHP